MATKKSEVDSLMLRPEDIEMEEGGDALVVEQLFLGASFEYTLSKDSHRIRVRSVAKRRFNIGDNVATRITDHLGPL